MNTVRQAERTRPAVIDLSVIHAVIFDTDGVVTDTARVHAQAWKRVFDAFLRHHHAARGGRPGRFDVRADYLRYVDGRSPLDGVRAFLHSRGTVLPEGRPDDDIAADTVHGLARRKDAVFVAEIRRYGVAAYRSSVALLRDLRRRGVRTAAVSSSHHCAQVLAAARVTYLFDARVDGVDVARLGLPGKPDPALFLEAARRLGVPAANTAVVEDSVPGVEAAASGGFGLVLGVDRWGRKASLYRRGAGVVVADLSEVRVAGRGIASG